MVCICIFITISIAVPADILMYGVLTPHTSRYTVDAIRHGFINSFIIYQTAFTWSKQITFRFIILFNIQKFDKKKNSIRYTFYTNSSRWRWGLAISRPVWKRYCISCQNTSRRINEEETSSSGSTRASGLRLAL